MASSKEFLEVVSQNPILGLIGNTPLVQVDIFEGAFPGIEVFAKVESFNPGGSIKDRPVLRMLVEATLSGALTPDVTILDSSSGNAGIAYAMIGGVLGYRVELVVPENASEERKRRIRAHGARIIFTDAMLGYDEALREVRRRYEEDPKKYFFCDQYGNEHNWRAHFDTTGLEILEQTQGRVTHFVGGVGTGGTITGVGRRLKEHNPDVEVHCVIPEPFPGVEGLKPLGSDKDVVPAILDESVIDRRWEVDSEEAYRICARLAARHGLFVGQSSGAYLAGVEKVGRHLNAERRKGLIVTVLNDLGERYFSTHLWD